MLSTDPTDKILSASEGIINRFHSLLPLLPILLQRIIPLSAIIEASRDMR